jgi:hypothetical protein
MREHRSSAATRQTPARTQPKKGRGLLRRGFLEELARIPDTRPTPQNASGAGGSI